MSDYEDRQQGAMNLDPPSEKPMEEGQQGGKSGDGNDGTKNPLTPAVE